MLHLIWGGSTGGRWLDNSLTLLSRCRLLLGSPVYSLSTEGIVAYTVIVLIVLLIVMVLKDRLTFTSASLSVLLSWWCGDALLEHIFLEPTILLLWASTVTGSCQLVKLLRWSVPLLPKQVPVDASKERILLNFSYRRSFLGLFV